MNKTYIAIDLKSFYASVECQERGLNPLTANLVVADTSRSEKTICLAVSPSLKAYGIPGRARLFEVIQKVEQVNRERLRKRHWKAFEGSSMDAQELRNPALKLEYIAAVPRMGLYIEYSTRIYQIYLRYISKDDIHVYSIDEVFIDATSYLKLYQMDAHAFARFLIREILNETGITATAGIGTNMFLAKCSMDIVAKHIPADEDGVRIAELDEYSYRKLLWTHKPLTDFWRVGRGYARKLEAEGIYTMGDIARCSIGRFEDYYNEDLLYKMFGINAETLIDHAWGWEPCTMQDIKNYKPSSSSVSIGQVLSRPYAYEEGLLIVKEMADQLSLDMVARGIVSDTFVLSVGYDNSSLDTDDFNGEISTDFYGRPVPKHAHGTASLKVMTNAASVMKYAFAGIYEKAVNRKLTVRRVVVAAGEVKEQVSSSLPAYEQTSLFDTEESETDYHAVKEILDREQKAEEAILEIKRRYGKNAVVKGMDKLEGATTIERNGQIGGHKA